MITGRATPTIVPSRTIIPSPVDSTARPSHSRRVGGVTRRSVLVLTIRAWHRPRRRTRTFLGPIARAHPAEPTPSRANPHVSVVRTCGFGTDAVGSRPRVGSRVRGGCGGGQGNDPRPTEIQRF